MAPGMEAQAQERIQQYRDQGWNLMQITPYKGASEAWYACPPGQLPMQHETLILQSEEPTTFTTDRLF
jgi:cell division protein FtsN